MSALATTRHDHANALLADLNSSSSFLPRREQIAGWLRDFVAREAPGDQAAEAVATENLRAIDGHLRAYSVQRRAS